MIKYGRPERERLAAALVAVDKAVAALAESVLRDDKALPCWVLKPDWNEGTRKDAAEAYKTLDFEKGLDKEEAKRSRRWLGVVACSEKTLELAKQANAAKAELAAVSRAIRSGKRNPDRDSRRDTNREVDAMRQLMTDARRPRLHLLQATREIPVFDEVPERIGFVWCLNNRSVRETTAERALVGVRRKIVEPGDAADQDRRVLENLPGDTKLFMIYGVAPHMRANLLFLSARGKKLLAERKTIHAALPILVPHNPKFDLPKPLEAPPKEPPERTRAPRWNSRLARKKPLTQSVPLYLA